MTTFRETLASEPSAKVRARLKAETLRDLFAAEWTDGLTIARQVGAQTWSLVFTERPALIRDNEGAIIGIDALIRVFRGATELKVDPHRICVNPPVLVPDGGFVTATDEAGQAYSQPTFVEDPREAYLRWLVDSLRGTPNAPGWRTRGTVTTVFGTTADRVVLSDDTVYATARAGTGTLGLGSLNTSGFQAGQQLLTGSYRVYEPMVGFDTSSIPDTDVISTAVLSLYGNANNLNSTTPEFRARLKDWSTTVDTGDFVAGASLSSLTLLATFDSAGYAAAYMDFMSDAAFPASIDKAGFTRMTVTHADLETGSAPAGLQYIIFQSADTSGTTQDPKLTITHAAPAGSSIPVIMHHLRQQGIA